MGDSKKRPPRLGRGLSSLMNQPVRVDVAESVPAKVVSKGGLEGGSGGMSGAEVVEEAANGGDDGLVFIGVEAIGPNRRQPRQKFDEGGLAQLAESIRTHGVMQPVIVRPAGDGGAGAKYELVAGERRWRAARAAGLRSIPALVRSLDERQLAEWSLVENLQREDLNPLERAGAFERLQKDFGLSHDEIAQRVGSDRSTITNLLRLLNLCENVRMLIVDGLLSAGQGRALAGVSDGDQQLLLAQRAIARSWSVRQVEEAVRNLTGGEGGDGGVRRMVGKKQPMLADLERQIGGELKTKVRLRAGRKKGTGSLTIEFYSLDQFDALLAKLGVKTD